MARNATIGALRVSLGLDSAQFQAGLKTAEASTGRFSKVAGAAFAAVAVASAAAALALGHAVKQAANHADQLSKTASRLGLTVEALSQLEYAGKMAGVSSETLSMALQRFTRRSAEAADGAGEAAVALKAMGIELRDDNGNLRKTEELFYEVADVLSRVSDEGTKVRLAFKLFDSEGVKLINMLDGGAEGLRKMAAESDRFGQTISTKTGKAAEEFNNSLGRMEAVLSGVVNKIMAESIPAMTDFTDTMTSEEVQQGLSDIAQLIIGIGNAAAWSIGKIAEIGRALEYMGTHDMFGNKKGPSQWDIARGKGEASKSLTGDLTAGNFSAPGDGFFAGIFGGGGANNSGGSGGGSAVSPFVVDMQAVSGAAKTAKEAIDPLAARMEELSDVTTLTHDPFEQMKMDLVDLKTLWDNDKISVEQYNQAVQKTRLNAAAATLGMVGDLTGALSSLFKDNKAFAIANAVVNTAEGITKALAQGGILGFAGAAAVAASGAAQIGAILSAQPGTSSAPSVSEPALADTQSAGGPGISLTLQGGGRYSRDEVVAVLESINDYYGDTGKINLVGAA